MFIIRLCSHASLQLVFAGFKAGLLCISKAGKATTRRERYALISELPGEGEKITTHFKIPIVAFETLLMSRAE